MTCTSVDLKAYSLGELGQHDKAAVQQHVAACSACQHELDRLNVMQTALATLTQEEIPQRIAFVSDKVFEPRWWQAIWRSGPAMGFASAALLAVAILVHGLARPVTASLPVASIDRAQIEQQIQQEVAKRVDGAVAKAVAETQAHDAGRAQEMLAAAGTRYERMRQEDLADIREAARYYQQQMGRLEVASNDLLGSQMRGGQ